ncbi:hypothetical protein [Terrabacter sp. 2RAF25]|uniref:hypothetical protein n=1 Tax=Terrabacter sp. 2RAF25 TaxID=3232998 RepID=UPI003F9E186E
MSAATEHQPSDSRDHRAGHLSEPREAPPPGRAGRASSTTGSYFGGAVVNVVLLVLVNRWPGWEVVPFLTDRMPLVLGLVNASLVVGIVVNLVLTVWHPPRLKALGDLAIGAVGTAAMVRIWQVFPFDLQGSAWETVVRVLLVVGLVGTGMSILVALVRLVRGGRNRT